LYGNHRNKYIVNIMYIILRFILKYVKFILNIEIYELVTEIQNIFKALLYYLG